MFLNKISERYNVPADLLKEVVLAFEIPHTEVNGKIAVADEKVPNLIQTASEIIKRNVTAAEYKNAALEKAEKAKETELLRQQNKARRNAELAKIMITSGYHFEGYRIVKYSGYISGDDALQVERGADLFGFGVTNTCDALMDSLKIIRRNALQELKEAAYELGCNAVIGVDFDYLTLSPETKYTMSGNTKYLPYVFGVTANGNAVIIEKDDKR